MRGGRGIETTGGVFYGGQGNWGRGPMGNLGKIGRVAMGDRGQTGREMVK